MCPPCSGFLGLTPGLIALSLQRLPGCRGGSDLRLHGVDPVAEGVGAVALPFPPRLFPVPFGPQAVDDEDQPPPFLVASVSAGALAVELLEQHSKRDRYGFDMPGLR